ncbi:MAG TPA: recombination mediator RecR [bacterium]|jgi:recombination protein RecR|nr:recombination mediator RecR [bacterium]
MASYPPAFMSLVENLARLPGVGAKSAQRLAFHLLKSDPSLAGKLGQDLTALHGKVRLCSRCCYLASGELCAFCTDSRRDPRMLCVVEDPRDVDVIEATGDYRGRYHVLLGVLSPLEGIGPEALKVRELLARSEGLEEVILALDPDVEGDATSLYLTRLLRPLGLKVTRLASGLPQGSELEYADQVTVARALAARREV